MRVSTWAAATLVWILLASGACLAHLIAQTGAPSAEPAAADKAGKELHALRISANAASIRLDGRIDDEGWMRAQVISDLTQEDPDNMMAPSRRRSAWRTTTGISTSPCRWRCATSPSCVTDLDAAAARRQATACS